MFRQISLAFVLALSFPAWAEDTPQLSLPIDCAVGRGCLVQNYVDEDPSPSARDFACGGLTYDGHKGTDIRLSDVAAMNAGVAVLASAAGTVKAIRDGMADISIRDPAAPEIKGKECGNGVLVDHGGGWVTQYCHMKRGSISVTVGAKLARGAQLGLVGLSGDTEFAHVHFEVRHGKEVVDPFTGSTMGVPACGSPAKGLWDAKTAASLAYRPAAFLSAGFADHALDLASLEQAAPAAPTAQGAALVAYVRVLGVRAGDIESLSVLAPDGTVFASKAPTALPKGKAQWMSFVGRKRTGPAWPSGIYKAHYKLERDNRIIVDETFQTTLR